MHRSTLAVIAVALVAPLAIPATAPALTPKQQIAKLKRQVTALKKQVRTVTAQRDDALQGLPDAITAVPISDFYRLVFTPAAAAYPCDSLYTSEDYWSWTFTRPSEFC